jgi:hypothetical protein
VLKWKKIILEREGKRSSVNSDLPICCNKGRTQRCGLCGPIWFGTFFATSGVATVTRPVCLEFSIYFKKRPPLPCDLLDLEQEMYAEIVVNILNAPYDFPFVKPFIS